MAENTLGENDFFEAISVVGYADKTKVVMHDKVMPDMRARFAMSLLERWGLIMAKPDGDDAAGRQKGRLADPNEIARHAVDISDSAFALFKDRGWLVDIGTLEHAKEVATETN